MPLIIRNQVIIVEVKLILKLVPYWLKIIVEVLNSWLGFQLSW